MHVTNLRTLSWIGVRTGGDFGTLAVCLRNNATHLQKLTLDFIDWELCDLGLLDVDDSDDEIALSTNHFAADVIGITLDTSGLHFPLLERLTLSEVSFRAAARLLSSALNFSRLKQLRLWNCPGTEQLLRHLTRAHRALPLVSLELVVDIQHADGPLERTVGPFLRTLSDLRDLFLSLYAWDWAPITDVITTHLQYLKRLVLHGREVDADEESEWFEEGADRYLEWNSNLALLFVSAGRDLVGIANPPSFMVSLVRGPRSPLTVSQQECLSDISSRISCRMLHLRASGDELGRTTGEFYASREELFSFADWAFGPDGIASLEVIAYGDFAFPELAGERNTLLCRRTNGNGSSSTFQTLEKDSDALWEWTQSHMDALSACAFRTITTA